MLNGLWRTNASLHLSSVNEPTRTSMRGPRPKKQGVGGGASTCPISAAIYYIYCPPMFRDRPCTLSIRYTTKPCRFLDNIHTPDTYIDTYRLIPAPSHLLWWDRINTCRNVLSSNPYAYARGTFQFITTLYWRMHANALDTLNIRLRRTTWRDIFSTTTLMYTNLASGGYSLIYRRRP